MERELRTCQNCLKEFAIEPDDFSFYEKINVPPPTFCPECRMIRRFIWRNERNLFKRTEGREGKTVFCGFPESVTATLYELSYWNSDAWDPMDYGKEYDFKRPFFEQFREFLYTVPWPDKSVQRMVSSDYCNNADNMKNCYLCFAGSDTENSAYTIWPFEVKESFDLYQAQHTELSYDSYMVDECYKVFFSVNCEESTDIWFSENLVGCMNCFGCVNLRNKQYYIFNKPHTKEAYAEYMKQIDFGSRRTIDELKKKAHDFWLAFPMRYTLSIKCMNSTGEHIERSKNLKECYSVHGGENLGYSQFLGAPVSDSYDYTAWGQSSSQMYEALVCGEQCDRVKFSWECWPGCRDVEYSASCRSSSDLFACVGLQKKKYCIFNKQYTKESFSKLRTSIIEHMNEMPYLQEMRDEKGEVRKIEYKYGEFFPPEFSPYAYNETIAQDFFPLTKDRAEAKGYLWRDREVPIHQSTVDARNLPDNIKNVPDEILQEIIACGKCHKPYRIIAMEIQFYRRMHLPLPHLCPNCRFDERFTFVNPPRFWRAKCECGGLTNNTQLTTDNRKGEYTNTALHEHGEEPCENEFETSYAPGRPEIVYCEKCYQQEVI
jgi:hypothetical protein